MTNKYVYNSLVNEDILYRGDKAELLSKTTKVIFDCDGVIVSDKDSYRQAIARSVDYYFLLLLGLKGSQGLLVTQEDIQKMKDTGAFNNDWNLTFTLIIYYLGLIIHKVRSELTSYENESYKNAPATLEILSRRLKSLGEKLDRLGIDVEYLKDLKTDKILGFDKVLEKFKQDITIPILDKVALFFELDNSAMEIIKNLCPFKIEEDDLLRRLFDEIYLGERLYTKFSNRKSFFRFPEGLIDKEGRIPSVETLDKLKSRFSRLGIYSERPKNEGFYILEKHGLLNYLDKGAIFFSEDIIKSHRASSTNTDWSKPAAQAFVNLLERFRGKTEIVAYVGDTISDALMILNARKLNTRDLIFIGTLSSSPRMDDLKKKFMELGAEVIVKDVNSIPTIFNKIGK